MEAVAAEVVTVVRLVAKVAVEMVEMKNTVKPQQVIEGLAVAVLEVNIMVEMAAQALLSLGMK
jgi:hypothetical protein